MYLSERQKISLKRIIVFILSLVLIIEAFFQYGQQAFVKAKEQAEAKYALYIDTSMVGVDAELLENGIGAYFYDAYGNASSESPTIVEKVGERDHLYKVDIDEQYPYVTFTEGTDLNTAECTSRIAIDWGLGVPCFKLNSENVMDGGAFYGLYTVYFDTNNVIGAETFTENGVGVYAYNSETESYSSTPVAMKESDKGEGIYEYSFDQPYQYIAFMNGYDNWNYSIATAPVYTEWGYAAPCFLLQTVNGEASTGLWWNLTSVVYFDASEIKDDDAFVENGVYLYAYNEKENGEKELLSDTPVKMLASGKGEDMYEYTLDKPYENVQYILGDSFDAEIQSEVVAIDWLNYAEPCYKMILERTDEVSVSSSDAEEVEIGSIEVPPKSEVENVSDEEALQPMDEARVTADGLSAIRVSHTMEWLGANNTLSANTVSSNDTNTTDENTTDEDDTDGTTSDGTDTDEDSTDENTTDESTTGDVQVDGELTDIGGDATTATVAAAVTFAAARSASSTKKTVYFYTTGNGGWNNWTKDCTMYIYLIGPNAWYAMTESKRSYTLPNADADAVLWEYTIDFTTTGTTGLIFGNINNFSDGARATVDIYTSAKVDDVDWYSMVAPVFKLDGGASESKKTVDCLGDLGPLSQAGNPVYFVDMTSTIQGTVTAMFTNSNGDVATVTPNSQGIYVIPTSTRKDSSGEEIPYTAVEFYDANSNKLGSTYNFFDDTSAGDEAFLYDESTKSTFYYGVTEKRDGTLINTWGAPPGSESLEGRVLYFYESYFSGATSIEFLVDGTLVELVEGESDDDPLSYTFDASATQETVLTIIATDADGNETKYHFMWSDLNANVVTLSSDIVNVTEKYYTKTIVYFDATMSKMSYAGDTDRSVKNSGQGIPYTDVGNVYYYATKDDGTVSKGTMTKVTNNLYSAEIPAGYSRIRFAGYVVEDEDAAQNGDGTDMYDIPLAFSKPCFYADNSDDVIYNGGNRGGYWDELGAVRDAEKGKGTDVVDIATGTFTRASDVFYVNATFYDYYTDYELNGYNRDDYTGTFAVNQRNWVTFRQFDQALSDYYEANSADIPIYTGHFQPSYSDWKTKFETVAEILNLYKYSKNTDSDLYKQFFSTNNSTINVNGNGTFYYYAAQGLVNPSLVNGEVSVKNGTATLPHFNKEFLTGTNSKNAVLGEVYENVAFPFTSDDRDSNGVKYWVFDSAKTTLAMRQDTSKNQYYLEDVGEQAWTTNVDSSSASQDTHGFFPFNETSTANDASTYNYGFGTKLEFKFRLTKDGTVKASDDTDVPITFTFSGDDDVWVFIDDQLALDVGGSHGQVEGTLDFAEKKATVSAVKSSAGSTTSGTNVTSTFTLNGANTDEHTLTMYYMERGMWESNMSITFNFPDENQLEVEKQVDEVDVNQELFAGIFDEANIFSYTIKNLATHYGEKEVTTSVESKTVTFNDSFTSDGVKPSVTQNTFEYVSFYGGQSDVVHWYAKLNDTTGGYQKSRYGIIPYASGDSADITDANKYLQFKYYYNETDTPALNCMYISLEDSEGNEVCRYLSGMVHGSASLKSKTWATITVDLDKFFEGVDSTSFDRNSIQYIKFGYNYAANFYLDDFVFKSASAVETLTGFVTKQYDIPDYGSATSGELEYPEGAVYTLTTNAGDSSYHVIGLDGTFVLADGDSVLFRDQFRRGSYIALEEEVDDKVFATSWTMYENGEAVTTTAPSSGNTNTTVTNDGRSLVDINTNAVEDGRTEYYVAGTDDDGKTLNNAYTSAHRITDEDGNVIPTFVFRSYSIPDTDTGMTKLKVVYTNKVKVGSLKITKAAADGTQPLEGEYTFTVKFSNVAGMGLEGSETITKTITLKVGETAEITGIPVNTEFTITEAATDKSFIENVTEKDDKEFTYDDTTKEIHGKITEEGQEFDFTVENMLKPVINISMEKKWENTNGTVTSTDVFDSIVIRLQRKAPNAKEWTDVILSGMTSADITIERGYDLDGYVDDWGYEFNNLEQYVNNDTAQGEWEYRVVEVKQVLDEDGNVVSSTVLEEGDVIGKFQVYYTGPTKVDSSGSTEDSGDDSDEDNNYTYLIENIQTATVQVLKKDKTTDEPLSGVTFQLEKYNATEDKWELITFTTSVTDDEGVTTEVTQDSLTTGEDGIVVFPDLADGKYRITEMKTADGYTLLAAPVEVEITRDGYRIDGQGEYLTVADNNTIEISIANGANLVLPPTGWSSPISLATGIILLSICLALCLMYRCKISKSRREGKPPG